MKLQSKLKELRQKNKGSRWVTPVRDLPAKLEKKMASLGTAVLSRREWPAFVTEGGEPVLYTGHSVPGMHGRLSSCVRTYTESFNYLWLERYVSTDALVFSFILERAHLAQGYLTWAQGKKESSPFTEVKDHGFTDLNPEYRCFFKVRNDKDFTFNWGCGNDRFKAEARVRDDTAYFFLPIARNYLTVAEMQRYWKIWHSEVTEAHIYDWTTGGRSWSPPLGRNTYSRVTDEVDLRLAACDHPNLYLNVIAVEVPVQHLFPVTDCAGPARGLGDAFRVLVFDVGPVDMQHRLDCVCSLRMNWPMQGNYGLTLPQGHRLMQRTDAFEFG